MFLIIKFINFYYFLTSLLNLSATLILLPAEKQMQTFAYARSGKHHVFTHISHIFIRMSPARASESITIHSCSLGV